MDSSIYKITHVASGRFYIGSAKNTKMRWRRHEQQLKNGDHHSKYLQRLYNKYGAESLTYEIVEYCEVNKLLEREQYYLDTLSPPLNSLKIAGSALGYKHSEETKRRQSERQKGRKVTFSEEGWANILAAIKRPKTEEHRKKISEANKKRGTAHLRTPEALKKVAAFHRGRKRSEETKHKISEAKKGKKMPEHSRIEMIERMRSPEMREHLSKLAKQRPAPNKGKPMSDEQKAKLSALKKGVSLSEEHKRKIREACAKGFVHTDEAKKKIAETHRKFTDEQVLEIRRQHNSGLTQQQLANIYGVKRHTIGRVVNGVGVYA